MFICRVLASFIVGIFNLYEDLYFTYLEINPLGKCVTLLLNILVNPRVSRNKIYCSFIFLCIKWQQLYYCNNIVCTYLLFIYF